MLNNSMRALLPAIMLMTVCSCQVFGYERKSANLKWLTYTDPRFDFALEYPANWTIRPRTDKPGRMGEVLMFRSPPTDSGQVYSIQIGHYLEQIRATESLSDWTDEYNRRASGFPPDQIQTSIRENRRVDNLEALFIRGTSPLTEYQYTNICRGETVWFFWSNIGDSADEMYVEIYDHMLNSLKFRQ